MTAKLSPMTITDAYPNVSCAERIVVRLFERFANSIAPRERDDFFHSANRDAWTREFAGYLERQIDRDRPSND